jgi:carboxylesterase type B
MGAYHSSEIQYVFNNVNGKPSGTGTPRAWTDSDRKLADLMSSYWVNFATTGDPNGKGLLKWPVYKTKDDLLVHFGNNVEVMAIPHKEALDFLDENFERQRKSPDTQ